MGQFQPEHFLREGLTKGTLSDSHAVPRLAEARQLPCAESGGEGSFTKFKSCPELRGGSKGWPSWAVRGQQTIRSTEPTVSMGCPSQAQLSGARVSSYISEYPVASELSFVSAKGSSPSIMAWICLMFVEHRPRGPCTLQPLPRPKAKRGTSPPIFFVLEW